jgi:hypothetical protein
MVELFFADISGAGDNVAVLAAVASHGIPLGVLMMQIVVFAVFDLIALLERLAGFWAIAKDVPVPLRADEARFQISFFIIGTGIAGFPNSAFHVQTLLRCGQKSVLVLAEQALVFFVRVSFAAVVKYECSSCRHTMLRGVQIMVPVALDTAIFVGPQTMEVYREFLLDFQKAFAAIHEKPDTAVTISRPRGVPFPGSVIQRKRAIDTFFIIPIDIGHPIQFIIQIMRVWHESFILPVELTFAVIDILEIAQVYKIDHLGTCNVGVFGPIAEVVPLRAPSVIPEDLGRFIETDVHYDIRVLSIFSALDFEGVVQKIPRPVVDQLFIGAVARSNGFCRTFEVGWVETVHYFEFPEFALHEPRRGVFRVFPDTALDVLIAGEFYTFWAFDPLFRFSSGPMRGSVCAGGRGTADARNIN